MNIDITDMLQNNVDIPPHWRSFHVYYQILGKQRALAGKGTTTYNELLP